MKIIICFFFFFFVLIFTGQELVFPVENIKSVQLSSSENGDFTPIVPLYGRLHLSFDDLDADEKDYYYKIEHCDRNWETSDLVTTEFVKGYAEEQIRDYDNSFNTLQDYTHYELQIPNNNTRLLISGNYRISILNEVEEVVFTRFFIVYEPITTVGVSVHRSRDLSYIDTQQSLQFSINHPNFRINNPQDEVFPVLLQNTDYSTQIRDLKPQFIRGEQLLYKYDKETAFWGGNEFLNFDTKEIRLTNMNIAEVVPGEKLYHTYLYVDRERVHDPYTYYPDVNGNFVIRNIGADDSSLEADYSWVHFALDAYEEYPNKEVYIYGNFNHYQLSETNKMHFNDNTGHYEVSILLKQGFYNYTYVTLNENEEINTTEINGSFDETENEYIVLVYYSKFGSYYDRIIGYGKGTSRQLGQ